MLSTYNKSVKIMYDLPWATHRYLMEPLTGSQHVSRILVKRYMSFIEKIDKSSKSSLKQLLEVSKKDVRQTTGHNLRSIMEITEKNTIEELNRNYDYHPLVWEQFFPSYTIILYKILIRLIYTLLFLESIN